VTTAAEFVGAGATVTGVAMLSPAFGWIVAGVFLLLFARAASK
jgi:hypothetical protein